MVKIHRRGVRWRGLPTKRGRIRKTMTLSPPIQGGLLLAYACNATPVRRAGSVSCSTAGFPPGIPRYGKALALVVTEPINNAVGEMPTN